ncbi:MAG TPA: hypothetical protein VG325_05895 [Solirubrobacteraceae bacterium]|jgi:hypothetical protein|nr:hypothetical protein [Solirubrobacteraceae bacterium]
MWGRARGGQPPINDRAWSAHSNVHPSTGAELVKYTALPAETGPMRAPDRLSVWPLEGGQYGIDAHYHGATGRTRAQWQQQRLADSGMPATVRPEQDGAIVRLGPLAHGAVWVALESFLGRPVGLPDAGGG